jgi:hypothetical protein
MSIARTSALINSFSKLNADKETGSGKRVITRLNNLALNIVILNTQDINACQ